MKHLEIPLIVVVSVFSLFASQTVFAQTEKLGAVKYTPPKGWTKTEKENVVVFNVINQASGILLHNTLRGDHEQRHTRKRLCQRMEESGGGSVAWGSKSKDGH